MLEYATCTTYKGGALIRRTIDITLDEEIYEELYRRVGGRKMSRHMEKLVRPHVLDSVLDDGYRVMTMDAEREREAAEWCD